MAKMLKDATHLVYGKIIAWQQEASVTAGTRYNIGQVSNHIPSNATYIGISISACYGMSAWDYAATVLVDGGQIYFIPGRTQATPRVRYTIFYTF